MSLSTEQKQKLNDALLTLCEYHQLLDEKYNAFGGECRIGGALKDLEEMLREDDAIPQRMDNYFSESGHLTVKAPEPLKIPYEVNITWVAEDIAYEQPEWSETQCEDFLRKIRKDLQNDSTRIGWEVINYHLKIDNTILGKD